MVFSFSLQFSCSERPPVFGLSHTVDARSTYTFKNDKNHLILRNQDLPYGPAYRLGVRELQRKCNQNRLYKPSCFNENHHIWDFKLYHMGGPKDGGGLNCKRKSIKSTFRKPSCLNENQHLTVFASTIFHRIAESERKQRSNYACRSKHIGKCGCAKTARRRRRRHNFSNSPPTLSI